MTEIVEDQTPPLLQGPSDKEKKYDRQLRLWAANGQQALEEAHLLLINSGSGTVGVETLKNLVLPGIGHFTIADDATVNEADLGVNFFLDDDSLGQSRAQACTKFLQELNPDVKGDWRTVSQDGQGRRLFEDDTAYSLIIYTHPASEATISIVQAYCSKHKTPSILINSQGFYSYFRLNLPGSFPIVDTHPDSTATTDLRLLSPWDELATFSADMTVDMETVSAYEHGHIPYVVLLLQYLEIWKKDHDGNAPTNYKDKIAFRQLVLNGARTDNPEGGEENFDEAVAAVLKTVSKPMLSAAVKEVFDYAPDASETESSFWIITDAVKHFYEAYGALPLPGSVPDMKAQSEVYVKLQNIYKRKAREDVATVTQLVKRHPLGANINAQEIESYCKNAAFLKLIRDTAGTPIDLKQLADSELNPEFELTPTSFPVYAALKGSEATSSKSADDILQEISARFGNITSDTRVINAVKELARAKGGELHNISALTGGMVAQEIIKIITKQYIPIDNTVVFDGIFSRSQVLRT